MSDNDILPEHDSALWRALTETVIPLRQDRSPRVRARPQRYQQDMAATQAVAPGTARHLPLCNDKRVRRGRLAPEARLDMHGFRADAARSALARFIGEGYARGHRCVLVITGKGRSGASVLRDRLPEWLNTGDCRLLLASYAPAHRRHGGAGAWYLFLRARRQGSA